VALLSAQHGGEIWYGYGLHLIPLAVFLACTTHIIGDMLTDSGCMLGFPASKHRFDLLPSRSRSGVSPRFSR
jgi:hypothetical protein